MHGHAERFTTDNYGLTTTPEDEYRIATGQMKCPEEARKDREGRVVREVKPLAVLMALPAAQRAKLVEMEVTAVVRAAPFLSDITRLQRLAIPIFFRVGFFLRKLRSVCFCDPSVA